MAMESEAQTDMTQICLSFIEISNFKSFAGVQRIGPLNRNFISVVGSNGAGKSNLTDAIGYVLNERTGRLRANNLGELVYGSAFGKPTNDPVFVKVTFVEGGDQQSVSGDEVAATYDFARYIVCRSGRWRNRYEYNENEVSEAEYNSRLLSIGINVSARNFMIFQGQIESVAALAPKERTVLLEELSGSIKLKSEYDRLRQSLDEAITEEKKSRQLLNTIRDDYSKLRDLSSKSSELENLNDQLEHNKVELLLSQLYYNECETNRLVKDQSETGIQLDDAADKRQQFVSYSMEASKKHARLERSLCEAEDLLSKMDLQLAKKLGLNSANEETLLEVRKETTNVRRSLDTAKEAVHQCRRNVVELQAELDLIEQQSAQAQAQECSPDDDSIENTALIQSEYQRLRAKMGIQAQELLQAKQVLSDSLLAMRAILGQEEQKHSVLTGKIDCQMKFLTKLDNNVIEIDNKIRSFKQSLLRLETADKRLERVGEIREELRGILNDEKQDDIEKNFRDAIERKRSVLRDLQTHFRGIHGRLAELCSPCHQRYHVAVAKVMGQKMNAIVCDTVEVARAAISYLKAHRHQPETFLSLDYIHAASVDDKVRRVISELPNARLVVDVVTFDAKYKKAVLFCFGCTVICETVEDAKKLTSRDGERFRAVTIEGILFEKSGVISGGLEDLVQKSKQWNLVSAAARERTDRKKALEDELNKVSKDAGRQLSRVKLQVEIAGLKKMIDVAEKQKDSEVRIRDRIATELEQIGEDRCSVEVTKRDLKLELDRVSQQLEEVKIKIASIEDEVFHDFCARLQMSDVRAYDKRFNDLEKLESLERRRQASVDRENHVKRLQNQISFDMDRTLSLEKDVKKFEAMLLHCDEAVCRLSSQNASDNEEIQELKRQMQTTSCAIDSLKNEISLCSHKLQDWDKLIRETDDKIAQIKLKVSADEVALDGCRQQRHNLLLSAQKCHVSLPMTNGSMADVAFTSDQSENEDQITFDYSSLQSLLQISVTKLKHAILDMEKNLQGLEFDIENLRAKVDPNAKTKKSAVHLELKSRVESNKSVLRRLHSAKSDLNRVRTERVKVFMDCFEVISSNIDSTYKALTQKQDVLAHLDLECVEEPYLGGITFGCIPSSKRYRRMEDLSGGEKTMAALALIFSFQAYKPAPFIVIDEVDASLDAANTDRVVNFIKACGYQFLVISLNEQLYMEANALLGVYSEVSKSDSGAMSSVFMGLLDLDRYADDSEQGDAESADRLSDPVIAVTGSIADLTV